MKLKSIPAAACVALSLLTMGGNALAAGGDIVSATLNPAAPFPGDIVNLKIGAAQGSYGIDCNMRWSLKNAANVEVKAGKSKMHSNGAPTAEYVANFSAPVPGIYTLEATSGAPDYQTIVCQGSVKTTLTVKDKFAISAIPTVTTMAPRPAGIQVVQLPDAVLQFAKLTAIKQVPFTNHSGETWMEVQGTGNCAFTIESAGVAPASFAASAAQPFPMKVRIAGAPLGSRTWKAQGTGSCSGTAVATFSVS
jgi:hypothetical protein